MNKIVPEDTIINIVASHLEVMGNPTRLKIMYLLIDEELGVLDLSEKMGMSMPAISHHLRVLKDKHIVKRRQEGKNVFYKMEDPCLKKVLQVTREHVEEDHK